MVFWFDGIHQTAFITGHKTIEIVFPNLWILSHYCAKGIASPPSAVSFCLPRPKPYFSLCPWGLNFGEACFPSKRPKLWRHQLHSNPNIRFQETWKQMAATRYSWECNHRETSFSSWIRGPPFHSGDWINSLTVTGRDNLTAAAWSKTSCSVHGTFPGPWMAAKKTVANCKMSWFQRN